MKVKEKDNGKVRVTLSPYELAVVREVLCTVVMGTGENSDVVSDFLSKTEWLAPSDAIEISGSVINDKFGHHVELRVD